MNPESLDSNERFERLERTLLVIYEQMGMSYDSGYVPIDMDPDERFDRLESMIENLILMNNEESRHDPKIPDLIFEPVPKPIPFHESVKIQPLRLTIVSEQACPKELFQDIDLVVNQDPLLNNSMIFSNQISQLQHQLRPLTQLTTIRHITTFISRNCFFSQHKKQELIELFREYVGTEGIVHKNRLDFYFACEGLKQQTDSSTITDMIISIYRFLLKSNIKVTHKVRSIINRTLKCSSPETNVFDPILEVVKDVIYSTTYKSFCGTDVYFDYWNKPLIVTSSPISNVSTTQTEEEFDRDLRLIRFNRYKFYRNIFQPLGNYESIRYEVIIYVRNRHLEWEIAWKKNFDQFK